MPWPEFLLYAEELPAGSRTVQTVVRYIRDVWDPDRRRQIDGAADYREAWAEWNRKRGVRRQHFRPWSALYGTDGPVANDRRLARTAAWAADDDTTTTVAKGEVTF